MPKKDGGERREEERKNLGGGDDGAVGEMGEEENPRNIKGMHKERFPYG